MIMHPAMTRPTACGRCGGCFLPDHDGDLFCLMCGRPVRTRRWEPAELESHRERRG